MCYRHANSSARYQHPYQHSAAEQHASCNKHTHQHTYPYTNGANCDHKHTNLVRSAYEHADCNTASGVDSDGNSNAASGRDSDGNGNAGRTYSNALSDPVQRRTSGIDVLRVHPVPGM